MTGIASAGRRAPATAPEDPQTVREDPAAGAVPEAAVKDGPMRGPEAPDPARAAVAEKDVVATAEAVAAVGVAVATVEAAAAVAEVAVAAAGVAVAVADAAAEAAEADGVVPSHHSAYMRTSL